MKIGPDHFYKCPQCGNVLRNRSLMSGNTLGAICFSDGRRLAPMLPNIPDLTKCSACNAIVWISDLKKIGSKRVSGSTDWSDHPEWKGIERAKHLELDDLLRALKTVIHSPETHAGREREIFIRQRIWWAYNCKNIDSHRRFDSTDEIDKWRQNCINLLALLNLQKSEHLCMAAELHRNLCNFAACLKSVNRLPDKLNSFKERMREECRHGNPLTVQLNRKKEQIEQENRYSILQNKNREEIASRLAEKVNSDETTAQNALAFYRIYAENCNAEAQYALAQLCLDERFYNLAEAIRWTEYAAFQGYPPAVAALDDFIPDDDGRYDAWV